MRRERRSRLGRSSARRLSTRRSPRRARDSAGSARARARAPPRACRAPARAIAETPTEEVVGRERRHRARRLRRRRSDAAADAAMAGAADPSAWSCDRCVACRWHALAGFFVLSWSMPGARVGDPVPAGAAERVARIIRASACCREREASPSARQHVRHARERPPTPTAYSGAAGDGAALHAIRERGARAPRMGTHIDSCARREERAKPKSISLCGAEWIVLARRPRRAEQRGRRASINGGGGA